MKDIKLFERWIKRAIKDGMFIFQRKENTSIVCDGITGFRISNKNTNFLRKIKQQTFQDLERDFLIKNREISYHEFQTKIDDQVEEALSKESKEREISKLLFQMDFEDLARVIDVDKEEKIFVNEKYIKYFEATPGDTKVFSVSNVSLQVFKKGERFEEECCFALPIRMKNSFRYNIEKVTEEEM